VVSFDRGLANLSARLLLGHGDFTALPVGRTVTTACATAAPLTQNLLTAPAKLAKSVKH